MPKRGMNKTATLTARIEPNLKAEAEKIIQELGINKSEAISMFYKQVILQRGLPFAVSLPKEKERALAKELAGRQA